MYYYQDTVIKRECDFIIKVDQDLVHVQITYELSPENKDGEIKGLKKQWTIQIVNGDIV